MQDNDGELHYFRSEKKAMVDKMTKLKVELPKAKGKAEDLRSTSEFQVEDQLHSAKR